MYTDFHFSACVFFVHSVHSHGWIFFLPLVTTTTAIPLMFQGLILIPALWSTFPEMLSRKQATLCILNTLFPWWVRIMERMSRGMVNSVHHVEVVGTNLHRKTRPCGWSQQDHVGYHVVPLLEALLVSLWRQDMFIQKTHDSILSISLGRLDNSRPCSSSLWYRKCITIDQI